MKVFEENSLLFDTEFKTPEEAIQATLKWFNELENKTSEFKISGFTIEGNNDRMTFELKEAEEELDEVEKRERILKGQSFME